MNLQIEAIDKSFNEKPVLNDLSLTLTEGEILVLLGPSGCGKTTLLRIIAGLEVPDHGRIFLNNQDISSKPPHQRGFGFVFQDYALFPHKNVHENVAFGLRMQNWPRTRVDERVHRVLRLVELPGFGDRPIYELSGGEQQRVALARSLAPAPRLLLLDEPLGALDRALRERLMLDLGRILKAAGELLDRPEGITTVYVTHDQAEAFAIADRVAVMNAGQFEQIDTPQDLYHRPVTSFVARFLGMTNILEGEVLSLNPICIDTAVGKLALHGDWRLEIGGRLPFLIRPEAAQLLPEQKNEENLVNGRIETLSFRGRYQIATISVTQLQKDQLPISLNFEFDTIETLPPIGSKATISISPRSIVPLERGKIAQ